MPRTAPVETAAVPGPAVPAEDCIAVPLKGITDLFPPELKGAIRKQPSEHVEVAIPRAIILPQLAKGAVRITFGQLRAMTPEIFFHADGAAADAKILLPLDVLVRRMNPSRREDQRQPSIPVNIPSIFGKAGGGQARPGGAAAHGSADPWYSQRRPTFEPLPEGDANEAPATAATGKKNAVKEPERARGTAKPAAVAGVAGVAPVPAAARVAAAPVATRIPIPPVVAAPIPAAAAAPAATRIPIPLPAAAARADCVSIPLALILPALPEEARAAFDGAGGDSVMVPLAEFEPRMRSGKLRFKCSELRGWCSARPGAPVGPDVDVDLPMATMVPLFMAARKAPDTRKKVEIDARIPDIFGKTNAAADAPVAAPEAGPVALPAPADLPAAAPVAAAEAASTWASRPLRIEQAPVPVEPVEMQPAAAGNDGPSGDWRSHEASSPAEIVQQIRALEGVTGAFLATNDGLLIAGDVPEANENVLAAFAPTVFSQLAKYADMARLGMPEAVDVHLASTTMHVRKAGKIYMGVLTPHGHPLPGPALEQISAALQPHAS